MAQFPLFSTFSFKFPEQNAPFLFCSPGEQTELLYKLSSYGVPTDLLPMSCTGTVKLANHGAWLNALRTRESSRNADKNEGIVECPRSYDVVFRKGPTFRNNPGNTHYRGLIEKYSLEHAGGNKALKYDITIRIVNEIEKRNGRFLEWSKPQQMWIILNDRDKVRKKIAAAFKQYKRTRGGGTTRVTQQQQKEQTTLALTIEDATSIVGPTNAKRSNIEREDGSKLISDRMDTLREYYSNGRILKRQKVDNNKCLEQYAGDGGSCFGMVFFPTE